jgi:CheY-like chemotaxis protein
MQVDEELTLISKKNSSSPPYVLVVEDEVFSRIHAVDLVEAAGYRAIEASNADDAIAILEARKAIRIVFTDINMPGWMDGLRLARAIRDRWPPIELILTSGHLDVPEKDIPERGLFFAKPYRDDEIVSALQKFASAKQPERDVYFWHYAEVERLRTSVP